MLFYEPLFLVIFFPTAYAVCLALNAFAPAKKWILLVSSAAFYSWGEPLFLPVLFVSSLLDYRLAHLLRTTTCEARRGTMVRVGILGNLAVLCFYKYVDFVAANLNLILAPLAGSKIPLLQIALPIGISFVVFEKITYLVDTYRGTSAPAPSFLEYGLFVFFFPKLLAGPILKYHEMEKQIATPNEIYWSDCFAGFLRFARGAAKKLLIADPVGTYADQTFAANPDCLNSASAWMGLLCFSLQIYFDFSGYSDMAIGLARMLGFQLRENFNLPYISRSLTEFWQRWHISLSTWIRDYLYVPLGGNRRSALRTHINLWICFLACGLWHGAAWNFVLWGAYNGLFLTLDRLFLLKRLQRCGVLVATGTTLLITMFGWTIFRSPSIEHLAGYATALVDWSRTGWPRELPDEITFLTTIGIVLCLTPATPFFDRLRQGYDRSAKTHRIAELAVVLLYVIAASRTVAVSFKPFIYFRF